MPAVPIPVFRRAAAPPARTPRRGDRPPRQLPLAPPGSAAVARVQPGLFDHCRAPRRGDRPDFDRAAFPDRTGRGRRRGDRGRKVGEESFANAETAAAVARGVLIRRLDAAYAAGESSPLGRVLALADDYLRAAGSSADELFQAVQAALFPEEFLPPGHPARGLLPPGGGQQLGAARLLALAGAGPPGA